MPRQEAEVGNLFLAGVLGCFDFAFDAAFAETAGNEDSAKAFEDFFLEEPFPFNAFRIDLLNGHPAVIGNAAVNDRFIDGFVGVIKLDVFADDADANAMLGRDELADDFLPMRHVGGRHAQV